MAAVYGYEDLDTSFSRTVTSGSLISSSFDLLKSRIERLLTQNVTGFVELNVPEQEDFVSMLLVKLDTLPYRSRLRVTFFPGTFRVKVQMPTTAQGVALSGLGAAIILSGALVNPAFTDLFYPSGDGKQQYQRAGKEPDWSGYPCGRRNKLPSVIIEVGVSESMTELERDAKEWLTKFGNQVLTVIIVKVWPKTVTFAAKVEYAVWKLNSQTDVPYSVPNQGGKFERNNLHLLPALTLDAMDFLLPTEMPASGFLPGNTVTVNSREMRCWVEEILSNL
ncbi:hypothetical protein BT96DRAFT_978808 [Gymnopus androsaceus JB14]|uniref:Restriction endonuclease domain-containing protein n=1 Tax=Gymnopus androsaceus JB14 TaxID=1447944 RepID=A0A6A4H7M2_9AGAR|nr:hypothetical protein BT96DRAFT_978808 [Gymnopus androsaceus JB14]